MNNPKIYIGAKIYWCNRFITLDEDIRKVETRNPEDIAFEDGMVSFKFVDVVEYEELGTSKRKVISEDEDEYFFGEFTPLEDLKATNVNGRWDNAIYNIEGSHGIGMVTSPDGFHSIMPNTGVLVNQLTQRKKFIRSLK